MPLVVPLAPPSPLTSPTLPYCVRDANSLVDAALEDMTRRLGLWTLAVLCAREQKDRLAEFGTSAMGLRGIVMVVRRLWSKLALAPLMETLRGKADATLEDIGMMCIGSHSAAAASWPRWRASLAPPNGDGFGASRPSRVLRQWRDSYAWAALAPCR